MVLSALKVEGKLKTKIKRSLYSRTEKKLRFVFYVAICICLKTKHSRDCLAYTKRYAWLCNAFNICQYVIVFSFVL